MEASESKILKILIPRTIFWHCYMHGARVADSTDSTDGTDSTDSTGGTYGTTVQTVWTVQTVHMVQTVQTVQMVQTVQKVQTMQTEQTVQTVQTIQTVQTVQSVHIRSSHSHHWHLSICSTVTKRLISWWSANHCQVSAARRWQLASHRCLLQIAASEVLVNGSVLPAGQHCGGSVWTTLSTVPFSCTS
jgi:hypothetical protein